MEGSMGFSEAVRTCFSKYATFSGRAPRSEFWFFLLFCIVVQLVGEIIDKASSSLILGAIISLVLLLPTIAVSVRRLHDIDRTGWWYLLVFTVILWILLLVWYCMRGTVGPNRYGPDPLAGAVGASSGTSAVT
jgi:uncharacterized membrane protein YhaH (DUF805 family)